MGTCTPEKRVRAPPFWAQDLLDYQEGRRSPEDQQKAEDMTHSDDEASSAHVGMLPGPEVAGHRIQRDEQGAAFLIDQNMVYCSRIEYKLLLLLLENADRHVRYAQLVRCMDDLLSTDPRMLKQARNRLMHHMSELRNKIWAAGLDIASVMTIGYILLSTHEEDERESEARGSRQQARKQEQEK